MITAKNIENLHKLVGKYALEDFKRYNKHPRFGKNGYKPHSYTLSPKTDEAREMLALATKKELTIEDERRVKRYLLDKMLFEGEIE